MSERTFSEGEIHALLERAAQLQADSQTRTDAGLTLAELEQVAAESGIDPAFLRAALREAETGVSLRTVAGQTETHVFVERTVPGTLSEEEWEAAVLRLRERFSSDLAMSFGMSAQYGPGVVEQLGQTRTWRHSTAAGVTTTATIRSADGVQHVRLQRRVGLASPRVEGIGYGMIVAVVIGALGAGITESGLVFLVVFVLALLLSGPLIARFDRRWRQKKLDEVEEVADEIARVIHDAPAEAEVGTAEQRAEAPRLDLDALPGAPEAERPGPIRDRTRS